MRDYFLLKNIYCLVINDDILILNIYSKKKYQKEIYFKTKQAIMKIKLKVVTLKGYFKCWIKRGLQSIPQTINKILFFYEPFQIRTGTTLIDN